MFTALVAVVLALVLGHVAPGLIASVRQFHWYRRWLDWLTARLGSSGAWRSRYGLLMALLPPVLLALLLQLTLGPLLLGLAGLLFGVLVLVYCWGPRDLDVDVEAALDAHDPESRRIELGHLSPAGEPATQDGPALVGTVARAALRRWFGVLFWFLLLGPAGALLYRLTALAAVDEAGQGLPEENARGARILLAALDWPVAQLMTLAMALVGNFDAVFTAWRGAGGGEMRLDVAFLEAAARASVRTELAEEAGDYVGTGIVPVLRELPELRDAMSLVWRMLLLWLAVLAVLIIAGWVG